MTITGAGNVGIGTNSPASLFTVGSSNGFQINNNGAVTQVAGGGITWTNSQFSPGFNGTYTIQNSFGSSSALALKGGNASSSTLLLYSTSGTGGTDYISFNTGTQVERMRITSSGNVGIGTATMSSSNLLEVNGAASIGYPDTYGGSAGGLIVAGNVGIGTTAPQTLLHVGSASASGIVEELQNSSGNCTFQPSSSALQVICSSDRRLKEDIDDAVPALPQLADMRVRNYTIKASGERTIGVIAQEMIWKHPDLVHMGPDGYYGVEAPNVWLLVKAIQELNAANDDLTARLSADDDALKSATDSIADLRESFEAYKSAHP
jgi:hypothetical protein